MTLVDVGRKRRVDRGPDDRGDAAAGSFRFGSYSVVLALIEEQLQSALEE